MEDGVDGVARKLRLAARRSGELRAVVGWPVTHRERFRVLFDDIMDDIAGRAAARNIEPDGVERAYQALVTGDEHLTSHSELMERTGMDYHHARQAAAVLSDTGDIHECYDDDWNLFWVRCDEFIREKCDDRRISLCRYFMMYDILQEFQDKVMAWYVRRNRRQGQPFTLRDLKSEYVREIQEEFFPEKPVGDEWSRHIAARYLRTAQDEIVRSYNLTY